MAEATEAPLDDDFRCAVWTAAQGFDPIGSATRFDRLVTVEIPLPWPAKAEDLTWIADLDPPAGTRVQAVVAEQTGAAGVLVGRWARSGSAGGLDGTDWWVPADDVAAALERLVAGAEPEVPGRPAPPEVLVCAHGARDRCCGGPGTRLAAEARRRLPGVRVRRTSHLGGHRYAPTALTLPDGRMWAHLDVDALAGIVDRDLPAPAAREFYRGNVALDPWSQVVEGAVLEQQGWHAVDFDEVAGTADVDGDRATVMLTWTSEGSADQRRGTVEVATRYPVLQCGLDPSHAEKTSPEYRLA